MSKKYLLLAIAAAALASCSQDETIDTYKGEAIDFRVSTGYITRAVAYNSANHMPDFNVTAFAEGDEINYFTNQYWVSEEGKADSWTTANMSYWPNDAEKVLNFYAYSPASIAESVTIDKTTQQIADFTPAAKADDQIDLLYAYNTGSKGSSYVGMNSSISFLRSR